jgi:hypothetical protein
MELFGLPEGLARAGKAVKDPSGGSRMLGSRPEGLYADRMRQSSNRGSIYADRMPQEPQRVFARYRSDIGYPEGLQQATAYRAANKGKALSHARRLGWQCTVLAATTYRVSRSATASTEPFMAP